MGLTGSSTDAEIFAALNNPNILRKLVADIPTGEQVTRGNGTAFMRPNSFVDVAVRSLTSRTIDPHLMDYGTSWTKPIMTHPGYSAEWNKVARANKAKDSSEMYMVGLGGIYQSSSAPLW